MTLQRREFLQMAGAVAAAPAAQRVASGQAYPAATIIPNAIAAENRLAGTEDWKLSRPAKAREIEGYASASSVARGESIRFYVNTVAPAYIVEVFRMGWYGGLGGRRVWGPVEATGMSQSVPGPDPQTGLVDCAWHNPFTLVTGRDWTTGVYLAKLTEKANNKQSYIIFVVRNDEATSDFIFQIPITTYQAYNYWGGKSAYSWGSGNRLPWGSSEGKPAAKVSFNRPYAASTNPAAAGGVGAGEFLSNVQPVAGGYPVSSAGWDYNLVRWLEKEGYDVTYTTNIDTHASPKTLSPHRAFLSSGHDEYWSWEMRANVKRLLDEGINLIFFGADAIYWQVRFEDSPATGEANRVMIIYKEAEEDPLFNDGEPSNDHLVTTRWRDAPVSLPEDALIGVGYKLDPVDGDIVIKNASHWVFEGTGLKSGSVLPGLLGYEVDGTLGHQPSTTEVLTVSPAMNLEDRSESVDSNMVITVWPSGAQVFATGSMQWSWGLDEYNVPELRSSRLNPAAIQITRNVLNRFGASHA
jgi:hypothetical protein